MLGASISELRPGSRSDAVVHVRFAVADVSEDRRSARARTPGRARAMARFQVSTSPRRRRFDVHFDCCAVDGRDGACRVAQQEAVLDDDLTLLSPIAPSAERVRVSSVCGRYGRAGRADQLARLKSPPERDVQRVGGGHRARERDVALWLLAWSTRLTRGAWIDASVERSPCQVEIAGAERDPPARIDSFGRRRNRRGPKRALGAGDADRLSPNDRCPRRPRRAAGEAVAAGRRAR